MREMSACTLLSLEEMERQCKSICITTANAEWCMATIGKGNKERVTVNAKAISASERQISIELDAQNVHAPTTPLHCTSGRQGQANREAIAELILGMQRLHIHGNKDNVEGGGAGRAAATDRLRRLQR